MIPLAILGLSLWAVILSPLTLLLGAPEAAAVLAVSGLLLGGASLWTVIRITQRDES